MHSLALQEVCSLITDGTHYTPPDLGTGVPFLTVKDIDGEGKLDFDGCSKIAKEEFEKAAAGSSAPILGDVLFSKDRSEEHTSELQSLMRISYAVFCLKKKTNQL